MSSDTDQIQAASANGLHAFNAKDSAGIAAVYTSDAMLLPPDAEPIEGLEAIAGFWGDFEGSVNSGNLETQKIFVGGDLANVIGKYRLEIEGQQAQEAKYIEMWTRGEAAGGCTATSGTPRRNGRRSKVPIGWAATEEFFRSRDVVKDRYETTYLRFRADD